VLRAEAVWNDGTPISADDFVVSWKLATSEAEGHCIGCRPRGTGQTDSIANLEGSDDGKTVTVTLKEGEKDPEWFGLFSVEGVHGGFLPAHVAAENGFDVDVPEQLGEYFEFLNDNMPTFSGGPYILVGGDFSTQVIKEPNPNWYGEEVMLDTHILRVINDEGAWPPALSNGEIDGGSPPQMNEDVVTQLQNAPGVQVQVGAGPSWEHLDFNLQNPWLQDRERRRAIFTAIDVDDIASRTVGGIFRTTRSAPTTSSRAPASTTSTWSRRPGRAAVTPTRRCGS
jgi:peptide/nickel transport system substrate-binding protein